MKIKKTDTFILYRKLEIYFLLIALIAMALYILYKFIVKTVFISFKVIVECHGVTLKMLSDHAD